MATDKPTTDKTADSGKTADNPGTPEPTDKTAAVVDDNRVVSQPAIDPTDPEQAGDATVRVDPADQRDFSDPAQNGNVGYSAEGVVVSNQQGEQHNTVQAADDERQEVQDIKAGQAEASDPFTDTTVTNQA